jgi:prepilin-type N-terminal cleavage/methylation domain-containing protein
MKKCMLTTQSITKKFRQKNEKGFTLIELSIVIVIIGLIVAGVVGGQALVKQANLRAVATEFAKIELAVNNFILEYNARPGDIPNAYSYWGASCHADANVCNGDRNRSLGGWNTDEPAMFWKHLSLAGLLEGNYSGVLLANPDRFEKGINTLGSKYDNSLYHVYGNTLEIGKKRANDRPVVGLFTPKEAYNIDLKIDDGKPGAGKYLQSRAYSGYSSGAWTWANCTTAEAEWGDPDADWVLNHTSPTCRMLKRNLFIR